MFFEFLVLLTVVSYFIYKWATHDHDFFAKRGVPYEKPLPLVGNNWGILTKKESFFTTNLKIYQKSKNHKVYGIFNFRKPILLINDPELIKKIAIKDFDYFPNHANFFPTSNDKLLDSMLSILKDQRWKSMRNTLSPVFTAAKMRAMFSLMNDCFAESLSYLHKLPKNAGNGVELELKQCFTRLSNDLIATTAFGLKVNSYENLDNEFYRIGQTLTAFRGKQMIKFMMANVAPQVMTFLGIRLFEVEQTEYFISLVVDAMKYREQHKIVRPDMIQLLMEAKKESSENWSDIELVAQCFVFFFAAFENNANFICTTCHELQRNPDVQQRLYEEAAEMHSQLKGTPLTYDDLGKMKYMDMVVSESLRHWALASATDRQCSKDYTLRDDNGNVIIELKAGDKVWFPIFGLHRDEQYFENPDEFDPERFSDERKHTINPATYIPFGVGPRICIGNRYALMQAKAMLYYLVLDFKIEPTPKTAVNLLEEIRGFQVNPKNGFWAKLVPRK